MPFGLPVWPLLALMAAVLFAASILARDDWAIRVSVIILTAYAAMQVSKHLPINGEYRHAVSAGIWIIAAGAISRHVTPNMTQSAALVFTVRAFIAASGLCYLWARVTSAPREFGSPPYLVADVLLIAVMLLVGWSLRDNILVRFGGIHSVEREYHSGASPNFRPLDNYSWHLDKEAKEPQKVGSDA